MNETTEEIKKKLALLHGSALFRELKERFDSAEMSKEDWLGIDYEPTYQRLTYELMDEVLYAKMVALNRKIRMKYGIGNAGVAEKAIEEERLTEGEKKAREEIEKLIESPRDDKITLCRVILEEPWVNPDPSRFTKGSYHALALEEARALETYNFTTLVSKADFMLYASAEARAEYEKLKEALKGGSA